MHKAIRTQVDEKGDEYSLLSGLDASNGAIIPDTDQVNVDTARQEFKAETDINNIIRRFGMPQTGRSMTFTDVDYSIDLQQAYAAMEEAKRAHASLPLNLREKYPTWRALLTALELGNLTINGQETPTNDAGSQPPPGNT